jgi:hypothetical protein
VTGLITRVRVFDAEGKCPKGHTHFARARSAKDARAIVKAATEKCIGLMRDSLSAMNERGYERLR